MTDPLQNADFQSSFAHNASAITPSEKVQLTLIVSPLRALNEPQMNSIR